MALMPIASTSIPPFTALIDIVTGEHGILSPSGLIPSLLGSATVSPQPLHPLNSLTPDDLDTPTLHLLKNTHPLQPPRPPSSSPTFLLMRLHMPPQLILAVEIPITPRDGTRKPALDLVGALVLGQVGRLAEALATDGALEGLEARVDTLVHRWGEGRVSCRGYGKGGREVGWGRGLRGRLTQGAWVSECLVADVADEGLLVAVDEHVLREGLLCREALAACWADVRLVWDAVSEKYCTICTKGSLTPNMRLHMPLNLAPLRKPSSTGFAPRTVIPATTEPLLPLLGVPDVRF